MNETERVILHQESEIRRNLAGETDRDFASNTRKLMPFLPSPIKEEADKFIAGTTMPNQTPSFQELFYIPIGHDVMLQRAGVYKDFLKEVFQILSEQPKVPTIIADGDCTSLKFTRSSIINSRLKTLSIALGYAGIDQQIRPKGKDNIDGYQDVIVDFLTNNSRFRAVGADSTTGQVIGTFDMFPNLFTRQTARMIRFRFGIEARTRSALNRVSQLAINERVIFFQGIYHKIGIEEWCKRNSVELKTMTPPSIQLAKPIFFNFNTRLTQE